MPTPEARAEELLINGSRIFKALPWPHVVVDSLLRIRHVSRSAREHLGYISHDEIDTQPLSHIMPDTAQVEKCAQHLAECPSGITILRTKSGQEFVAYFATSVVPWANNDYRIILGFHVIKHQVP